MANNAKDSRGFTLKAKVGAGTLTAVKGIKDFSGLRGGTASIMDTTDLESTAKEKLVGLPDEGSVTFTANMLPADAGQILLTNARPSGDLVSFELASTKFGKKYSFDGYVMSADMTGGVDQVVGVKFVVEVSGAVTEAAAT
jgi:hypothetical protein